MLGLRRLTQVIATGAVLTVAAAPQAHAGCATANAEDLLNDSSTDGASGFVLTERLCGAALVRSRATPAVPEPEPEVAHAEPLASLAPVPLAGSRLAARPTLQACPVALAAPLSPLSRRDAAGQARIRALAPLMAEVAQRHNIDPLLLHALAHIESRHQAQAISPAGARGLMQVMPATGRSMGVAEADRALLTPEANLEASAKYLKQLQARFGNNLTLVLAAYNAGEGAVERNGRRVPPYPETQAYVRDVMAVYAELRRRFASNAGVQA